ncbi:MAG: HU family DNA-binding protein [Paludibacteraceae bacterium]|nr:HU family DNA-binding protein [Paludibacteraceae bacterium]
MKKFELVREVAKQTGISQDVVNKVVDNMSEVIVKTVIEDGDEVNLPALGKFKQKVNPARKGINPLNKKSIDIPETHTLAFKPTSSIKVTVK